MILNHPNVHPSNYLFFRLKISQPNNNSVKSNQIFVIPSGIIPVGISRILKEKTNKWTYKQIIKQTYKHTNFELTVSQPNQVRYK